MSFLAPWFLWLAAGALVPVLIHLLRRRIGLEVEFPAARYLARAEREHSRTLRMRNLLLMLLRVVAVLLLAAAAARPTARVAGAGHTPTALAILLDNSMSASVVQDGAPLMQRLRELAAAVLRSATPEDRLWLVTADGVVRGGPAASLRDELERVRPLAGSGSPTEALARAITSVQASGIDARQVAVLTDGQRTAWSQLAAPRDVPVLVWTPTAPPPMNRAVTAVQARPVRWTPRGVVIATTQSTDSTTYRMALGERTLARGTIAPGEQAVVRAAPAERGWTAGVIEIEPDELVADNVRHFALWIGPPPAVLVSAGAGPFARSAVDVLKASGRVADGAGIQIAAADEATTLPALLLPPSDPVRLGAANRSLERLGIPWRFGRQRRESSIAHGELIRAVSVSARYELDPRGIPDAETLAVVAREPWMVGSTGYVLVASPLVPAATSLPVSAAFVPWLADVVSTRLAAEPGAVRDVAPGQHVVRPAGVDALESIDGGRTTITGQGFDAPGAPGTYFLVRDARRVGAIVVNPEPAESRLERWSAAELGPRVSGGATRVLTDGDDWVRQSFAGVARRSLVLPLLVALLVVLAAETVVATSAARVPG